MYIYAHFRFTPCLYVSIDCCDCSVCHVMIRLEKMEKKRLARMAGEAGDSSEDEDDKRGRRSKRQKAGGDDNEEDEPQVIHLPFCLYACGTHPMITSSHLTLDGSFFLSFFVPEQEQERYYHA
jgi:hypothetical protein